MKKATLATIASACGVSIPAVSMAFNAPQKLSKTVRENIINEAIRQGYFQNKRLKVNKITVIFNEFRNFYWGEYYHDIVYGIFNSLMEKGLSLKILNNFSVEYREVYDSSGLIFVGKVPESWLTKAKDFGLPFVLCGHPATDENLPGVVPDFEAGYRDLLNYFIHCGHKKIGLITGESDSNDPLRLKIIKTYKKTLEQAGLKCQEKYIISADYANIQSLAIAFHKMISLKPEVTAIQFADDVFAYLALQEAKKNNIKVPQELSIAGFDGTTLPWFLETPQNFLTTAWVDSINIGAQSVNLLLDQLQNPRKSQKLQFLPIKLLIRNSVQRVKKP